MSGDATSGYATSGYATSEARAQVRDFSSTKCSRKAGVVLQACWLTVHPLQSFRDTGQLSTSDGATADASAAAAASLPPLGCPRPLYPLHKLDNRD